MADMQRLLAENDLILAEAAIIEALRRSGRVQLHPRLENVLLIYNRIGKTELSQLCSKYISVAHKARVPIFVGTPTWRANKERLSEAGVSSDVNKDAVAFMKELRGNWISWQENIPIAGLISCKNDCYKPVEGLSSQDAYDFHSWQIEKLAEAGVDFLLAPTIPTLPEATGIALAMAKTDIPYIISFVISREGTILDGNSLEHCFCEIDAACAKPPLGYMINCAYPSFLNAQEQPELVVSRLIGFQANASSLDHADLNGSATLQVEDISDWGNEMLKLNRKYGVKILGGCCGTGRQHLQYIVDNS
jgi:S-methylmethionine-dependent homocysteine/selenocysteine methylase